ncbi:uncharacterized protein [Haliotis asinina]|uniref:uncharacterized protein n=1 Tax=Haliotis asinina TaxID=109174 RepID=UPI003531DE94
MNTRSRTSSANDNSDIGSKVSLWDESRSGMADREQVGADLGQSRVSVLHTQDTNHNQMSYSHGAPPTRSLIPERYGDINCSNIGQEIRSLPQPQHHRVPDLMVGNANVPHRRSESSFMAPQSRAGSSNVRPEMSNGEIFRDAVTSPQIQYGSNSDEETRETGASDQLDNSTRPQVGADHAVDETGSDMQSTLSKFSTLTIDSHGSSLLTTESSGYHSPIRSEPSDTSSYCWPGRSAGGQTSGRREAVSSFGQHRQEYSLPDMDIPPHCLIDTLGPPLEENRKKKRKTSENRQTRHVDQMIYNSSDGRAGMERPSSSGATQGVTDVRSSHGDREAITTSTHHKQRKKSKKEPYPAEVDDSKRKKMENNLAMFTDRVDPQLLQLHLRGCLKDYQCEHILNQSDVKSRPYVNQILWNYLKRAPHWWQNLERALEECGYNELLAKLREEQKHGV